MAEKYTGIEKYIFSDTYTFFLKYQNIPNEDYYWQCCAEDAKLLCFKYKDYPLARRMVMNVLEQLEFKICNRVMNGRTYQQWEEYLGDYKKLTPFSAKIFNNKI